MANSPIMYKYFQICFSDNDVKKILANEQNRYTLTHTHTHAALPYVNKTALLTRIVTADLVLRTWCCF